jgi:hypothetical protein
MQSNEQLWNGTISALKAADVRSEEQLDAMSSEDLKMANVPFIARHHLVKKRKGEEGAEDRPSGRSPQSGLNTPAWRHDSAATTHSQTPLEKSSTSLSAPSTASTPSDSAAPQSARSSAQDGAPLLYDASVGAGIKEESIGEDGEGEEVTLTINVARQRIKLKARSTWDLENIREEILRQHKAKGFRTRDIDQFYLKGKYISESLTVQELITRTSCVGMCSSPTASPSAASLTTLSSSGQPRRSPSNRTAAALAKRL